MRQSGWAWLTARWQSPAGAAWGHICGYRWRSGHASVSPAVNERCRFSTRFKINRPRALWHAAAIRYRDGWRDRTNSTDGAVTWWTARVGEKIYVLTFKITSSRLPKSLRGRCRGALSSSRLATLNIHTCPLHCESLAAWVYSEIAHHSYIHSIHSWRGSERPVDRKLISHRGHAPLESTVPLI